MKTDNEVLAEFDAVPPEDVAWFGYDYSADFNLLMPVWYKFKALKIEGNRRHYVSHLEGIEQAILHEGCAEACKLLAEGIRWYNTIKK